MKKILQNNYLIAFLIIVTINFIAIAIYDLLYYDPVGGYSFPPLLSFFYHTQEGYPQFFSLSHLLEFILVLSLIILLAPSKPPKAVWFLLLRAILPSVLIIGAFYAYDIQVRAHLKAPTVQSLKMIAYLKDFMGKKGILLQLIAGLSAIVFVYLVVESIIKAVKMTITNKHRFHYASILFLKITSLLSIVALPNLLIKKFYIEVPWFEVREIWSNGRIATFYKKSISELQAIEKLESFKYPFDLPPHLILFPDTLREYPNIYFILLESFADISRLKDIHFSKFPIHLNLLKYMPDSTFSLIISPVIGGKTAQATFEILTGTPALEEFAPVEFLIFGNQQTYSLLRRLKEQGYSTWAFAATSHIFFNTPVAYKDLGFDTAIFIGSLSPYKEKYTDRFLRIPDEEAYSFILNHINMIPEPRFVYIVTMYGHWPWQAPKDTDTITVFFHDQSQDQDIILTMANIMYRKQKSLSEFIDTILKLDSNALIVAFSDHNPPFVFIDKPVSLYTLLKKNKTISSLDYSDESKLKYDAPSLYHVPILIIYKGRKINIPVVNMHRVPELIYHLIANDTLPDTSNLVPMEIKRYLYKQIIKQSREDL